MYKIQISNFSPFWNNSDINYPEFSKFDSQEIFSLTSDMWVDIPNGSVNWLSSNAAWVQIDVVQYRINYLRVIDDYSNKVFYFFVVDFFDMTTKTVKLNLELDNWMTYGKQILESLENSNPIVFFNKKHMNRYSILDNLAIPAPDTVIDKYFSYSYKTHLPRYTIAGTTSNPNFMAKQLFIGDMPKEAINYKYSTGGGMVGSGVNNIIIASFNDNINNRKNEFLDIINRYNIIDLGSSCEVEYNIILNNNLFSAFYTASKNIVESTYGNWTQNSYITFSPTQININKTFLLKELVGECVMSLELVGTSTGNRFRGKLDLTTRIGRGESVITRETLISELTFEVRPNETMALYNFGVDANLEVNLRTTYRLYGRITNSPQIPVKTTYNVDYLNDQQHLLNTDDLTNLGESKLNVSKFNFEIAPYKYPNIRILRELGSIVGYNWKGNDNNFFKLSNGFYLYGVVRFPLYREGQESINVDLVNFISSDSSNNLFVYIPILVSDFINPYFQNNTRANVEASFGDNLMGIISSPIPPTSLSERAITIKALFNRAPYITGDLYLKMSAFAVPAFKNSTPITINKTPYAGDLYKVFTPPTTPEEIWNKKLTTLSWENESILNSPQYLDYYITNGTNNITINNYVNVTYSDLNYLNITWGLTPISSIIFLAGIFDLNRYEPQKSVLTYNGILPSNSSSYNQWILENSASINMGLANSRATRDKEMAMGFMDILAGGAQAGIGGKFAQTGFKWGTPEMKGKIYTGKVGRPKEFLIPAEPNSYGGAFYSGIGSAANGTRGMLGGVDRMVTADLNYKNYQRQISGMNSDAQTKSSIISSDDSTYINTFSALAPLSVIYTGLKPNDCKTIWWNCFINGYNVNRQFNFKDYDNRTFFNYFSVTDISPWILATKDIPQEYKEWFISKFEEGVRLWKTWMTYNIDNKELFVDRIDNAIAYVKK